MQFNTDDESCSVSTGLLVTQSSDDDETKLVSNRHAFVSTRDRKIAIRVVFHIVLDGSKYRWVCATGDDTSLAAIYCHKECKVDLAFISLNKGRWQKLGDDRKYGDTGYRKPPHVIYDQYFARTDSLPHFLLGTDAYMIGCPVGLYNLDLRLAIVRKGILANKASERFDIGSGDNGANDLGVIDIACFHGSSGSPILASASGEQFGSIFVGPFNVSGVPNNLKILGILANGPDTVSQLQSIPRGCYVTDTVSNGAEGRFARVTKKLVDFFRSPPLDAVQEGQMMHVGFYVKAIYVGEMLRQHEQLSQFLLNYPKWRAPPTATSMVVPLGATTWFAIGCIAILAGMLGGALIKLVSLKI